MEPGDIDGVAEGIRQLLSIEKPVEACRERAVRFYNKDDRFLEYITLYEELIQEQHLEEIVEFTGRLSNSEMMDRMDGCSIGIISYPFSNYNNIFCSPNKIFEYAAISLPFIATAQPFIKEVQDKYNIGRTFEIDNVDSFISNVNAIIEGYPSYTQNTHQFLIDYSYEKEEIKLINIFNSLT